MLRAYPELQHLPPIMDEMYGIFQENHQLSDQDYRLILEKFQMANTLLKLVDHTQACLHQLFYSTGLPLPQ